MLSNLQIEKQTCIPTLKWYQSKEYVIMNFEIYNGINPNIKINENNIDFQISSNNTLYNMNFYFFENVDVEQSKYEIMDKCVKIILKKTSDNTWTFLTNDKNIYKNNIKIDWNGWTDDSDDETNDQTNNQQFDFQKMMENMKGMDGMENLFENANYEQQECDENESDEEEGENDEDYQYEDDEENPNNIEENNNLED